MNSASVTKVLIFEGTKSPPWTKFSQLLQLVAGGMCLVSSYTIRCLQRVTQQVKDCDETRE